MKSRALIAALACVPALALAAENPHAITTFESAGLYWTPPANPGAAGCTARYCEPGGAWKEALTLWYDPRNHECRGSIVGLKPGTRYEIELAVAGSSPVNFSTSTWSEKFPVARTVQVPSGSGTLAIKEGGTASGYVLYTGAAGGETVLDAQDQHDFNVTIAAPYVIVRGLTLKG